MPNVNHQLIPHIIFFISVQYLYAGNNQRQEISLPRDEALNSFSE
jgi:hypothetical protein